MQKIITIDFAYRPYIGGAGTNTYDFTQAFQSYLDDGWVIEHLSTTHAEDRDEYVLIITVVLRK